MQEKGATDELMATALQSGLTAAFVVAALAIGYGAAELLQVWSRIEPGEEVHVSSATWR